MEYTITGEFLRLNGEAVYCINNLEAYCWEKCAAFEFKKGERVDQAILHCCKRTINIEPEEPANDTPAR